MMNYILFSRSGDIYTSYEAKDKTSFALCRIKAENVLRTHIYLLPFLLNFAHIINSDVIIPYFVVAGNLL